MSAHKPTMYKVKECCVQHVSEIQKALCTYAHSPNELHVIKCWNDDACYNPNCRYSHSSELREDYCRRLDLFTNYYAEEEMKKHETVERERLEAEMKRLKKKEQDIKEHMLLQEMMQLIGEQQRLKEKIAFFKERAYEVFEMGDPRMTLL